MAVSAQTLCIVFFVFFSLSGKANAFGAGNIASISKIEGQNWRHGDIEDALLTLFLARAAGGRKFSKLDVQRVYFGNWLRDYSQAVDVGTVKYVSAEAIRILLWVLGFMSFGYDALKVFFLSFFFLSFFLLKTSTKFFLGMVRRSSKSRRNALVAISPLNTLIILSDTLKAKTPATMTGVSGVLLIRNVNWLLILGQVSITAFRAGLLANVLDYDNRPQELHSK